MAEGWLRPLAGNRFESLSAGANPACVRRGSPDPASAGRAGGFVSCDCLPLIAGQRLRQHNLARSSVARSLGESSGNNVLVG